jgi:hypothetical protein
VVTATADASATVTATAVSLFGANIAVRARRGDWAGAVHEAYALGLISADDIEQAFDTGADVIAHLQR